MSGGRPEVALDTNAWSTMLASDEQVDRLATTESVLVLGGEVAAEMFDGDAGYASESFARLHRLRARLGNERVELAAPMTEVFTAEAEREISRTLPLTGLARRLLKAAMRSAAEGGTLPEEYQLSVVAAHREQRRRFAETEKEILARMRCDPRLTGLHDDRVQRTAEASLQTAVSGWIAERASGGAVSEAEFERAPNRYRCLRAWSRLASILMFGGLFSDPAGHKVAQVARPRRKEQGADWMDTAVAASAAYASAFVTNDKRLQGRCLLAATSGDFRPQVMTLDEFLSAFTH